jgi:diguanylate cyclase (GGDEF)-like protein
MIEGLDTRTLTVMITMLAIVYGVVLSFYAKTHSTFHGFLHISSGFLILASGFALVSFRTYIYDWFAITFSGLLVIYGIRSVGRGALHFFGFPYHHYQRICNLLLVLQLISSTYYVVFEFNSQVRITIICSIFAIQCFYLAYKLLQLNDKALSRPVCFLYGLFILFGGVFIARALWTAIFYQEVLAQAHTIAHISSLAVFLLMIVLTSSIIIWSASERLRKELERQATIDPLTQIYNRRALLAIVEKEITRAQRESLLFSVILMDIDHFKLVNDKYGHQYGDQVLSRFCQIISENLRSYDIFARYGGEEFVLFLPNTSGSDALKLAEKLRVIIHQSTFSGLSTTSQETITQPITASFGVTESNRKNRQWDDLLSQADKALYQAKQQGRNRVVYFTDLLNS